MVLLLLFLLMDAELMFTVHLLFVVSDLLFYEAETYKGLFSNCYVNIVVFGSGVTCNIETVSSFLMGSLWFPFPYLFCSPF